QEGGNASAGDSVFAKDAKISRCMEVKRWNINVFFSLYRATVQMGIFFEKEKGEFPLLLILIIQQLSVL
ncbi:hypothetical protein, partial [Sharpea porci]|uniref:hypothetical protein n=1 Tax=Sharpea porci TaxID=2652286 RepID=UPI002A91AE4D